MNAAEHARRAAELLDRAENYKRSAGASVNEQIRAVERLEERARNYSLVSIAQSLVARNQR